LRDLRVERVAFAEINLVATLVGSLFCLGIGRLVDRLGSRLVLTVLALALGAVVLAMASVTAMAPLLILITLTRGLGQSALSVVSLTMVGKWFSRRLSTAMGVYAVVMSIGFMIAFPLVGAVVLSRGWRAAWSGIGIALVFGLAPLAWVFVRRTPEACGLELDGGPDSSHASTAASATADAAAAPDALGASLGEALRSPAFWVFALCSSVYGLVASGIALFNESILAERGFDPSTYHRTLVITALTALVGNFGGGLLAERWSMRRVLVIAMALLGASLAALPQLSTQAHIVAYAVVMGLAGGFVMVVFFAFWGRAYGRAHLGRIQGAAQILTVLASAVGPLLLATCVARTGSYASVFYVLAIVVGVLGVAAAAVPMPKGLSAER
jgi:MFS family permease